MPLELRREGDAPPAGLRQSLRETELPFSTQKRRTLKLTLLGRQACSFQFVANLTKRRFHSWSDPSRMNQSGSKLACGGACRISPPSCQTSSVLLNVITASPPTPGLTRRQIDGSILRS